MKWILALVLLASTWALTGPRRKSKTCPVIYIVAQGVTDHPEGIALFNNYSLGNPAIDTNGDGTRFFKEIRDRFTECVQTMSVKVDEVDPSPTLVDMFTTRDCEHREWGRRCFILSHHRLRNMTVEVAHTVDRIERRVSLEKKVTKLNEFGKIITDFEWAG